MLANEYIGRRGSINGRVPSEAAQPVDGRKLDLHGIVVSAAGMPLETVRHRSRRRPKAREA